MDDRSRHIGERLGELHAVMARLRAPDGCPWDRAQTLRTLRSYLLEETYELLEAIDSADVAAHREELGDLLFQAVFQAAIREEQGAFDLGDAADGIRDKLLRRHPHVFGEGPRSCTPDQVRQAWDEIKRDEKRDRGTLDGVPETLPALLRAVRIGEKAARVGFDWPEPTGVRRKIDEELAELDAAVASGDLAHAEDELGDLLFALCNYARHLGLMPEDALRGTIRRFQQRFAEVERALRERGQAATDVDIDQLEAMWQRAKRDLAR
ncbi:MAG: nucleoside triphosphate pyrophosphohydrolase [Deltaproteobacteria bacterium]|nr:nucleoside triphosphate pyrophosphohydrolase [Deltaproteobacteria bacterium]